MTEKISKKEKFKRFLKRNMTKTWAMHFSYQVVSFIVSVALVFGVASYAFDKSYDERKLRFVDGFTITAHTGSFDTEYNSLEYVEACIKNKAQVIEVDVRTRPNGTVVISHELAATNSSAVEISKVFELIKNTDIMVNLDIKELRALEALHDLVVEYGLMNRVFLTGILPNHVNRVREDCPDIAYYINYTPSRSKIFSTDYQIKILDMLSNAGAIGINCNFSFASATLCSILHHNGYKLSVWTVDSRHEMRRVLMIKPDNITTRKPDKLQKIIDDWGK